ncbi:L-aminopeptidase/D-esterase-like protein [Actinoplanes lutulentus]|uniref:L-aminopeptidase/D-esterase-like protein n=1 Tax=Actinoplanes lutulentus TaxID=1287878 RepID=A0A327Z156_9ACTN|nr:P1 family peptidase [Actinoplanes lutulentus]MBB2948628.1 L-aminopeptidase/D-esterase-like protein [Actinoplanes lutulentus]RAK28001.1 L-aminopeptidase/D-esterase-like protein [Actinoplanes lutulentus]
MDAVSFSSGAGGPQLLSAWAGHWTGDGTGVTVILPPPGTVGSGEVRGGAPATREFALLEPSRLVDRVDAVVLSGGSAFGLSAADGVMRLLRSRGLGFPTPLGPVPIVVGMSIFDASVAGTPPSSAAGQDAALAALRGDPFTEGTVGAGTGAATGRWRGSESPGGLGVARGMSGNASIVAVAVVNAWGDVIGPDGTPVFSQPEAASGSEAAASGSTAASDSAAAVSDSAAAVSGSAAAASGSAAASTGRGGEAVVKPFGMTNTTIAVVLTDAKLTKADCYLLAQSGHTGFARALNPAHSRFDGDAVVALATGDVEADLDLLRTVAANVTAEAIRSAVSH